MLSSICSFRLVTLFGVKFRSRALTALNLLPSMATEVRDGLEVRRKTSSQPHQFDVALALSLQSATQLRAVEVAVDIDLE